MRKFLCRLFCRFKFSRIARIAVGEKKNKAPREYVVEIGKCQHGVRKVTAWQDAGMM